MMPGQGGDQPPPPVQRTPTPDELNYRVAEDPNSACATCQNMLPDGNCTVLKMQVQPNMTCDAYMQKGDTMTNDGRAALENELLAGGKNGPAN